jgi:hypothetical protein
MLALLKTLDQKKSALQGSGKGAKAEKEPDPGGQ